MKIYVGNLPFETTDEDLAQEFSVFGEVVSANVVIDRVNGRSRGARSVPTAYAQNREQGSL